MPEYGHFVPLKRDSNYACPEGAFGIALSHPAAAYTVIFVGYLITSGNEDARYQSIDHQIRPILADSRNLTDDFFVSRNRPKQDRKDLHIATSNGTHAEDI